MKDGVQTVYNGRSSNRHICDIIADSKKPFIVCEPWVIEQLQPINSAVYFHNFTPNPTFDDALAAIELFEREDCDFIVSIGGGSAIDVGKSVNVLNADEPRACHLAIPTTAGTGSEATHFAVLYKNGEKMSLEHPGAIPEFVILDPVFLDTLPLYHKKSAMLDALCQAIESLWAKGKTHQSVMYAQQAIDLILPNIDDYFTGDQNSALSILQAANLAGKAINIGKTTAPHAMSYKLSTMFGIAHGHAVALCMPYVAEHLLKSGFAPPEFTCKLYDKFVGILIKLDMSYDFSVHGGNSENLVDTLTASVNSQRLGNHAVVISTDVIKSIYRKVLNNCIFQNSVIY